VRKSVFVKVCFYDLDHEKEPDDEKRRIAPIPEALHAHAVRQDRVGEFLFSSENVPE
jgi:hypothetical protein